MNIDHRFKPFSLKEELLKEKYVGDNIRINKYIAPKAWILEDVGNEYRDVFY
jgi:hypothetical protein